MSDTKSVGEHSHQITVRLAHDFEFVAEFDDVPGGAPIRFDEPTPMGGGHAPNAAAVLGAAVGNCLAASLTFCLRRARLDVEGMTAHVTTRVKRNERGRFRIEGIAVELEPVVGGQVRLDQCAELFEDFCTVTASVKRGIPVHISLKPSAAEAAAPFVLSDAQATRPVQPRERPLHDPPPQSAARSRSARGERCEDVVGSKHPSDPSAS